MIKIVWTSVCHVNDIDRDLRVNYDVDVTSTWSTMNKPAASTLWNVHH